MSPSLTSFCMGPPYYSVQALSSRQHFLRKSLCMLILLLSTSGAVYLDNPKRAACGGEPEAFDTTGSSFKLRAYNIGIDDPDGVPLGYLPSPTTSSYENDQKSVLQELATFDNFPSNLNITWTLQSGSLIPDTYQHVVDNDVIDGGPLTWHLGADLPPPARDYCAVSSNSTAVNGRDSRTALAVHGDSSSFYLCPTSDRRTVYFQPDRTLPHLGPCYPITIELAFHAESDSGPK